MTANKPVKLTPLGLPYVPVKLADLLGVSELNGVLVHPIIGSRRDLLKVQVHKWDGHKILTARVHHTQLEPFLTYNISCNTVRWKR